MIRAIKQISREWKEIQEGKAYIEKELQGKDIPIEFVERYKKEFNGWVVREKEYWASAIKMLAVIYAFGLFTAMSFLIENMLIRMMVFFLLFIPFLYYESKTRESKAIN